MNPLADGVILSHKEGCARGIASNHGDPEHLWNQLGMGYTMNTFRKAVKAKMNGGTIVNDTTSTPVGDVNNFPATPFLVKVIIDDLNYRSEPSMSGKVKGQTGKGTFTITKVKDGWGKLKSGAGWIWLKNSSYCTVVNNTNNTKKSVTEIAKEVIQGKWGNGSERKRRLTQAGYNYETIQKKVNELL